MNYLSHFAFAVKPLDEPFYCLGLIYPDLNKDWRNTCESIKALKKGSVEHDTLDTLFHTMGWFQRSTARLTEESGINRLWANSFCHCILEVAIDFHVYNVIKDTDLCNTVKVLLNSEEVQDFLSREPKTSIAPYTVNAIVNEQRLENYATREGGIKTVERLYDRIAQKARDPPNLDLANIFESAIFFAATFYPHNVEYLRKELKQQLLEQQGF